MSINYSKIYIEKDGRKIMKKNNVKKVAGKFLCMLIATLTFANVFTLAGAKQKVKNEPFVFMPTTEIDEVWNMMDKNTVYVEKARYKIIDKKGETGRNLENPEYEAGFRADRYKGKRLKKGNIVTCYFFYNNKSKECVLRIDYYKGIIVHMTDV